jgi:hypothetical protein
VGFIIGTQTPQFNKKLNSGQKLFLASVNS